MANRSAEALQRIMPVTLSVAELAEMEDLIELGQLPKDHIEQYFDACDANVFGQDAPKDRHGNRKEQGLGSAHNQTQQSVDAYKRWHKGDSDYAETVKRMETELAASNARRKSEAEKSSRTRKRRFVA
jgi:hypothetical protein